MLGLIAWSTGSLIPCILGHTLMDFGLFAYGLINTGKKGCSMFVSELRCPEANNPQNSLPSCLAPLSR
ncbi:MAG: hypothetical protein ABSE28_04165 [Candidatus Sulfotelmatobacter sp.]|jgi:hypothetical protein